MNEIQKAKSNVIHSSNGITLSEKVSGVRVMTSASACIRSKLRTRRRSGKRREGDRLSFFMAV